MQANHILKNQKNLVHNFLCTKSKNREEGSGIVSVFEPSLRRQFVKHKQEVYCCLNLVHIGTYSWPSIDHCHGI